MMRGNSLSHYVDRPVFCGVKNYSKNLNLMGINFQRGNFSGEKKTNKHKQIRGIVPEMGGAQIVYVFPLFLGKKGNT